MTLPPMPPLPEPAMEDVPYELWGQNVVHPTLYTDDQLRTYAEQYGRLCAEAEREACADVADAVKSAHNQGTSGHITADSISQFIRARGQR